VQTVCQNTSDRWMLLRIVADMAAFIRRKFRVYQRRRLLAMYNALDRSVLRCPFDLESSASTVTSTTNFQALCYYCGNVLFHPRLLNSQKECVDETKLGFTWPSQSCVACMCVDEYLYTSCMSTYIYERVGGTYM